jgi:hypothetical protein
VKPGDLILVKANDLISDVIEDVSNSPYSHTAGLVKDKVIIEAVGFKKIGYQSLDYYKGKADVYTCDSLTEKQRETILEVVISKVGGQYDYFLLVWEFIRYTFGFVLPYKEGKMIRICSTLWADAYRKAGVDLCPGVKYPSPGDLAVSKLLRKIGSLQ